MTDFITYDYELSAGHAPRGRGSWAFSPIRRPDALSRAIFWTPGSTTYAEAKRLARAHAKALGLDHLYVLS